MVIFQNTASAHHHKMSSPSEILPGSAKTRLAAAIQATTKDRTPDPPNTTSSVEKPNPAQSREEKHDEKVGNTIPIPLSVTDCLYTPMYTEEPPTLPGQDAPNLSNMVESSLTSRPRLAGSEAMASVRPHRAVTGLSSSSSSPGIIDVGHPPHEEINPAIDINPMEYPWPTHGLQFSMQFNHTDPILDLIIRSRTHGPAPQPTWRICHGVLVMVPPCKPLQGNHNDPPFSITRASLVDPRFPTDRHHSSYQPQAKEGITPPRGIRSSTTPLRRGTVLHQTAPDHGGPTASDHWGLSSTPRGEPALPVGLPHPPPHPLCFSPLYLGVSLSQSWSPTRP